MMENVTILKLYRLCAAGERGKGERGGRVREG